MFLVIIYFACVKFTKFVVHKINIYKNGRSNKRTKSLITKLNVRGKFLCFVRLEGFHVLFLLTEHSLDERAARKTEKPEFLAFFIGMVRISNDNTENHDVKNTFI